MERVPISVKPPEIPSIQQARDGHLAMETPSLGPLARASAAPPKTGCSVRGNAVTGPRRADVAGFSLVEVLVAVLVLTIGLLGLAALQITGVRANDSAELRTTATLAAHDVADRVRADPVSFFPQGQASKGTVTVDVQDCEGALSGTDAVTRWKRDFCALGLPPPSLGDFARVDCGDSALNFCGGGNCAISVRWDDRRGDHPTGTSAEGTESTERQIRFCTRIPTAI